MSAQESASQWPPEVPPYRRPGPPQEPVPPRPAPQPQPIPILPSWEEVEPTGADLEVRNRLLEERIVLFGGELDGPSADRVTAELMLLGRRERDPVELHLTVRRSVLDASLALADAMDLLAAPVHAVVRGTLAGPAVAVLCAAKQRAAHRHATLLLSVPHTSAEGTSDQLTAAAEEHQRQVALLRQRIVDVTGRPEDEVGADLEAGRLLSAEEARDYGLLHELL